MKKQIRRVFFVFAYLRGSYLNEVFSFAELVPFPFFFFARFLIFDRILEALHLFLFHFISFHYLTNIIFSCIYSLLN